MLSWLLKAGAFTALLRVIAIVTTLAFVSVMSHLLPKAEFGTLAVFISIVTLAGTFGSLGQSEWTIKHASPQFADGKTDAVKQTIAEATKRVFCFSVPVGAVVSMFFIIRGELTSIALLAGLNTIALSICIAWAGASRSVDKLAWSLAPKDIIWRAGAIIISLILLIAGVQPNLQLVALSLFGVLTTALIFQARSLDIGLQEILNAPLGNWATWLVGLQIMISMVAIVAQNTLDVFFVGTFMSADAAAEYFPANRIALVAGFFFLPFQMVIGPRFSRLISMEKKHEVQRLNSIATILVTIATIITVIILHYFYDLYSQAFGTTTIATKNALNILLIAPIITASLGFPETLLVMNGKQKYLAKINIIALVLGCILLPVTARIGSIVDVAICVAILVVFRKIWATTIVAMHLNYYPVRISTNSKTEPV